MAYIEPKVNWIVEALNPSDMNRIEGNTKDNHDLIVAETASRLDGDTILQSNLTSAITSEQTTRSNADIALQADINTKQPLPTTSTDPAFNSYPIGTVIIVNVDPNHAGRQLNSTRTIIIEGTSSFSDDPTASGDTLSGTWRARGFISSALICLYQRVS